ncbi:unnamed protein product [Brachionus calyciflorus]|uniref:Centrosomal protein 78 n=1 Tax=Brachionus calyciflorus TaxID=104777 RepID=A0A813WVF3_9BILA|nr:unnamed protein product [Brachionus calyciflorus]
MSSSQFMTTSNYLMDNQFKLSAHSVISSTALPSNLSSSANGSSRYVNQTSGNFWDNYEHLCALQNVMPLQSIKSSLASDAGTNLTIMADKLKSNDWDPFLSALRVSKNFKTISFVSTYNADNDESSRMIKGYAKLKKPPAIRNKEKTNKLCRSLKDCLSVSTMLNKLELYNIPLSVKDCSQIAKGLRSNKTVKTLSLDRCLIGDEGLAVICKEIQNTSSLNRVNFSNCNLSHEGANILATLIKVQALKRHNEAWKDSLRYGRPDLDSMFGIRRITINSNQQIGDQGVQYLADAFKSDLWLKALDLQDCGITTQGANHLLDGLKFNAMMHVLDVRLNVDIDRDTLQKIMEQVMINSSGNNTEYEWMPLTQQTNLTQSTSNSSMTPKKIKKRRNTNTSFTKKPQINSVSNSLSRMKRCKSTGSVICNKSPGIPWRTAARANRAHRVSGSCAYRKVAGLSSENYDGEEEEDYDEEIMMMEDEENEKIEKNYQVASSTFDFDKLNGQVKNMSIKNKKSAISNESIHFEKGKNLSTKEFLIILQKEQESKTQLEDLLLEFQDENTKLKSQLSVYKSKLEQQAQELNQLKQNSNMNRTLLDDDKALEIIELTLYKYQNFLDFLRNAGFGKLIDIGEMTQPDKKKISKQSEIIRQQKKLFKERMSSGSLRSKSPNPNNNNNNDQQKYFLGKINKAKSKQKNFDDTLNYDFYNSSRLDETENHDIDTLLSNALEISRSFRRFNSSSINNSTMYNNYNHRRNNDMLLSEIEETNKENNSKLNESELPSFNEVKVVLGDSNRKKKSAITTVSLKEEEIKSNSSISPATTVISARSTNQQAPKVQARTSIRNSISDMSRDKEIEVEDVSEILSEDETINNSVNNNKYVKTTNSRDTVKSSDKSKKSQSIDEEDEMDDDNF